MNTNLLYRKINFIVFVVLLIVFLGGFYNISVKQNLASMNEIVDQITVKQQLLSVYSEKIKLEGELVSLNTVFPQNTDSRWLMVILNDMAKKERVEIVTVRPMSVVGATFHDKIKVSVHLEGSYHQLGRMMAAIDNTAKYIQVEELKAYPVKQGSSSKKMPQTADGSARLNWQMIIGSVVPKI
ncbi:MAG: type 4a pilus biogenesis protein PilO [Candidatus Kaelpia aquatica]|nr:type 4a pilus biogenesis protein PilO [Candidatus Kaelpia aquatica]